MFAKGLFLDSHAKSQPDETYLDALNVSLVRNEGIVSQEPGTTLMVEYGLGFRVIGHTSFPDDTQAIFLTTSTGISKIVLFNGETTILLLEDGAGAETKLAFSLNFPIEATTRVDAGGRKILYWTDGLNPIRRLVLGGATTRNVDSLRLFLQVATAPKVRNARTENGGGILKSGTYFAAFSLETSEGDSTPYLQVTGPISVSDDPTGFGSSATGSDGAVPQYGTSKAIVISLENLDSNYSYVRPALIMGTEVRYMPRVPIAAGEATIRMTGGEQYEPGAISEVVINPAIYETAKALEQEGDNLYLGNLSRKEDLPYQAFANAIEVSLVTHQFSVAQEDIAVSGFRAFNGHVSDMRHPETAYLHKGFKRGEVYALYISLILKNGTETAAYHIPGRGPVGNELDTFLPVVQGGTSYGSQVGAKFRFQTQPDPNMRGMGFWQNENEAYPTAQEDPDGHFLVKTPAIGVIGSLQGAKVRHHHIPFPNSAETMPFRGMDITPTGMNAKSVGFRLANINFPNEIKEKIAGYKIYYARRSFENARWVDQMSTMSTKFGPDNGSLLPAYKVANPGLGGDDVPREKYLVGQPFRLMRTRENVTTLSQGYVRRLYTSAHQQYPNFTSRSYMPTNNVASPDHDYRKIDSAGYLEENTIQGVGNGDTFFNGHMAASLVLEIKSCWPWNWDVVDIFRYRENVYWPFQNQIPVSTGYVGLVNETQTGDIFGGDTFLSYYGSMWGTPEDDGTFPVIHQTVVESADNIGLRHEGLGPGELYWPKNLKGVFASTTHIRVTANPADPLAPGLKYMKNYIGYNPEYSALNDIKPAFPFDPTTKKFSSFPTRVVRSSSPDKSFQKDHFRVFLENDFMDLTTQRGPIVKIAAFNGGLLIHAQKSLFRTAGREELEIGDVRAFVGSGNIFAQPPREIFATREGYGGLLHPHHAILTTSGYVFVNPKAGAIYLLSDGMNEISTLGIKEFLKDRMAPASQYTLGYDPENTRIFVSCVTDPWTLSYIADRKIWESFHSGPPEYYFWNEKSLFAASLGGIHARGNRRNTYLEGKYFGSFNPFIMEAVIRPKQGDGDLHSVLIDSIFEQAGTELRKELFDSVQVRTADLDTGIVPIEYFTDPGGNARRTNRIWKVNRLRNMVPPSTQNGTLPAWRRRRITSEFFQVKLRYINDGLKKLNLFGFGVNDLPSIR